MSPQTGQKARMSSLARHQRTTKERFVMKSNVIFVLNAALLAGCGTGFAQNHNSSHHRQPTGSSGSSSTGSSSTGSSSTGSSSTGSSSTGSSSTGSSSTGSTT